MPENKAAACMNLCYSDCACAWRKYFSRSTARNTWWSIAKGDLISHGYAFVPLDILPYVNVDYSVSNSWKPLLAEKKIETPSNWVRVICFFLTKIHKIWFWIEYKKSEIGVHWVSDLFFQFLCLRIIGPKYFLLKHRDDNASVFASAIRLRCTTEHMITYYIVMRSVRQQKTSTKQPCISPSTRWPLHT